MILRLGQEDTEILLLIHLRLTLQDLTTTTTTAAAVEEEEGTRVTIITRPVAIVMADATLGVTLDVILDVGVDMAMTVAVTIGPRMEAVEIAMDHRHTLLTRAEDTTTTTVSAIAINHRRVMGKISGSTAH